jgi:hypothetical protein
MVFRIYGFYRTGTNWLAALLRANVPSVTVLDPRDEKHSAPHYGMPEPGTIAICIAKHPLALAASYRRFQADVALSDVMINYRCFLESIIGNVDERPAQWRLVAYEDLLKATEATLTSVVGRPIVITDPVVETIDREGVRGERFTRREYYLDALYLGELTRDEIDLVNKESDWTALARFGYSSAGESV